MRRSTLYTFMALHVCGSACTYVLGKSAAAEVANAAALTLARAGIAAVFLLALTGWAIPRPRFTLREWLEVALLGVLLVPLNQFLFLKGLEDTVPGHPPLIYALTPMVVLLMTSALKRRAPAALRLLGVVLAVSGVFVLFRPWQAADELKALRRGDTWLVLSLFVWSTYTLIAGRMTRRHDPRTVTAWALVLGALLFVPFSIGALGEVDPASLSIRAWIGLGWLALVTSGGMMLLWNVMLRHLEPVQVAICANAQPAATALLAAVLAAVGYLEGEQDLGPTYWAGTALVIAGVLIVQRPRRAPVALTPVPPPGR